MFKLEYRGDVTQKFVKSLFSSEFKMPLQVILTTTKLSTLLPSLKSRIDKLHRSRVVYQITCSGCNALYVGQTVRHLTTRLKEHGRLSAPVGKHLDECGQRGSSWPRNVKILESARSLSTLLALEALHIRELERSNNGDDFKSTELLLKI